MPKPSEQLNRWTIIVRPIGSEGPWEPLAIPATSIIQAEAIARRLQLDVWAHTPGLDEAKGTMGEIGWRSVGGDAVEWHAPRTIFALLCEQCRYPLEGLVIADSQIDCPECGYRQQLFNRRPDVEPKWSNSGCAKFALGAFALIGGLVVLFVFVTIASSIW